MNPKNETTRLQSAEKLFERIAADTGPFIQHGYHPEWGPRCVDRPPYTPPSNVAAWLRKYDIEHPKGRDYEALTKAAKRKPVGYWEDAPRGAKFGGGEVSAVGAQVARSATGGDAVQLGVSATSNHPAPSSDSDLYEPVGTVPVVGDRLAHPADGGNESYIHDVLTPPRVNTEDMAWVCDDIWCGLGKNGIGWRILKRKQPQVAGARAWKTCEGAFTWLGVDGCVFHYAHGAWEHTKVAHSELTDDMGMRKDAVEIHDPAEVAALVEEVRKAGLLK